MPFCVNCGQETREGIKFCAHCGTPISGAETNYERRSTYEGELHKCPNCGTVLGSFVSVCPSCGYELRGARSATAIRLLAEKLENVSPGKQRDIIKNFPIPNTKEDIFEFMLLASSNFNAMYYAAHLDEDDISDAWLAKIEQCYSKAKISFGNQQDFEKIESLYLKIKSDCENAERTFKYEEKTKRETLQRTETAKDFKNSKMRIVIIIFAVFSALCIAVSFNKEKILSGIIAILMFVLFVVAFLMGSGVIKEKIKNMRLIPLILAFALFIPYFAANNTKSESLFDSNDTETIEWNMLAMGDKLPDYGKNEAEVVGDNDRVLILYFYNQTKDDFENYIDSCKNFGYNIDIEDDGTNFTAYNLEGYYLHVQWLDWGDKKLTINLEIPKDKGQLIWPNSTLVKDVPAPSYLIGEVSTESDSAYAVYLVGVEETYFSEYVSQCMSKGFNIDYSKSKDCFHGENNNGISITVEYVGFNTLYIYISN